MTRLRLTRRAVDEIPYPKNGQVFYRDSMLLGFGLRVGAQSKVFFAEGQVNKRTRRVTIGRADVFAPEVARKKALTILGEMADGQDPNAEKRKEKRGRVTLEMAFDRFFEARKTLSPNTVSNYRRSEQLYLKVWRKKEMKEIDRQMVLKKHQEIVKKHGETTANNAMRHFRSVYNFTSATQNNYPSNPVQILTQARAWFKERRRQLPLVRCCFAINPALHEASGQNDCELDLRHCNRFSTKNDRQEECVRKSCAIREVHGGSITNENGHQSFLWQPGS